MILVFIVLIMLQKLFKMYSKLVLLLAQVTYNQVQPLRINYLAT